MQNINNFYAVIKIMTSHRSGRIHPHQRDANLSSEILGDDIVLEEKYVISVHETE